MNTKSERPIVKTESVPETKRRTDYAVEGFDGRQWCGINCFEDLERAIDCRDKVKGQGRYASMRIIRMDSTVILTEIERELTIRVPAVARTDLSHGLGDAGLTDEANAAFIVQACNSHEALVKALRLIEQSESFNGGTWPGELQQIARAALKNLACLKPDPPCHFQAVRQVGVFLR